VEGARAAAGVKGKTMSRTPNRPPKTSATDMRAEYEFDYREAKPNRFASQMTGDVVTVVLEPDVAKVFDNSESVNRLLRSVISAIPGTRQRTPVRKPRRKVS
jgi:hypothetical protein